MEDVDFTTSAMNLGFEIVSLDNPKVWHDGGRSIGFNPNREEITKRNKELFRKKWIK